MHSLLENNEIRRFHFIKYLHFSGSWVKLSDAAETLSCSERTLKYDLSYFNKNVEDFVIETSSQGVRLTFPEDKNFDMYVASVLENSLTFQLLEMIFFAEKYSVADLANKLFVSPGKLYALIKRTNQLLAPREIKIETVPCRIIGNEENIRTFFYAYLFDKYSVFDWPYDDTLNLMIDQFSEQLTDYYGFDQVTYDDFNVIRIILIVNLNRYKHNHLIDPEQIIYADFASTEELFELQKVSEDILKQVDTEKKYFAYELSASFFINILFPFHQMSLVRSYNDLLTKALDNRKIAKEIVFLNHRLDFLANHYEIPLKNKDTLIYHIYTAACLRNFDPRTKVILSNTYRFFAKKINDQFPDFSQDAQVFIVDYLEAKDSDSTTEVIYYFLYMIFIHWDQLYLHLDNRFNKLSVLVLSGSYIDHSKMIRDILHAKYSNYISVNYFSEKVLLSTHSEVFEQYDLIISDFPHAVSNTTEQIRIESIPTVQDFKKIEEKIVQLLPSANLLI